MPIIPVLIYWPSTLHRSYQGETRGNCSATAGPNILNNQSSGFTLFIHKHHHINLHFTLYTKLDTAPPGEYPGFLRKDVRQRGENLGLPLPKLSNLSRLVTKRSQERAMWIVRLLHCFQVPGTQMLGR